MNRDLKLAINNLKYIAMRRAQTYSEEDGEEYGSPNDGDLLKRHRLPKSQRAYELYWSTVRVAHVYMIVKEG